jgi:hypothetical protein
MFLLLGCTINSEGSGEAKAGKVDPLAQEVINYQDSGYDLAITVGHLADKYGLRTGIDTEIPLPQDQRISVDVPKGTVADVLDRILAQEPDYKWAAVDGVVNIEPRQNGNSILDLRIREFRVSNTNAMGLHEAIVSCPEVKKWLSDNHLVDRTTISIIAAVGKGFSFPELSLSLRGASLRAILKRIVRSPGFHSWGVGRWGENSEYIYIGVN